MDHVMPPQQLGSQEEELLAHLPDCLSWETSVPNEGDLRGKITPLGSDLGRTGAAHYLCYGTTNRRSAPNTMPKVEIYSRQFCGYCSRAKRLLSQKGVGYIEYDVIEVPSKRDEMVRRTNGRMTVPQIFIDGEHIGGSDDLYALDSRGGLDRLLKKSA